MSDQEFREGWGNRPSDGAPSPAAPSSKKLIGEATDEPTPNAATAKPAGKGTKAKAYKPPTDAADLADLFVDTGAGRPAHRDRHPRHCRR
jgi:hypothetical protein